MTITSLRCPVIHAHVTCVTDFEGAVTKVLCAEYQEPAGTCRIKGGAAVGGPLARLVSRAGAEAPGERRALCDLRVS